MPDQDQTHEAHPGPHENDELANGREGEDSVYLAALKKTAPAAAIAAVGFTVIVYLLMGKYLNDYLKAKNLEPPDYSAFVGDAAVVVGLIVAILLWLLLATFYKRYTSARSANRRNYILLVEELDRLSTRIQAPNDVGYGPHAYGPEEQSGPGSGVLKAVRQQALDQATHERDEIRKGLADKGMPWVTGLGYIELWHRVHRAEEALIKVEPYTEALEGAMRDESRLAHSTMANKDVLLKRLKCSVTILDDTDKACEEMSYLAQPAPKEWSIPSDERTQPIIRAKALGMLSDVRYEINSFRDNVWEGIVIARNQLADTSAYLGFAAYALLGLAIFSNAPRVTITHVITYFLIGALTGLFARAQAEWTAESAVDDFGLASARLLQVPWLSGLAAVGGVLLTSVIDAQYAGTEEGFQQLVAIFDNRPVLLVVAAVFGLAPDLIIRRLQQQVDKYKGDLQSTQSSQSRADVSKIASRQTSSGDPQLTS
jgi:hypothetical protein